MLENSDLVSIVMPAYNTEQYIQPMIDSLKNQEKLFNIDCHA